MTEPSEPPSAGRETPDGTPQTAPPYPYPYQPAQPRRLPAATVAAISGYPQPPSRHTPATRNQAPRPKMGSAIASLVLAIIGLLSSWIPSSLGHRLGLIAVVIGFVASGRVKRGDRQQRRGRDRRHRAGRLGDHRRLGVHRDLDMVVWKDVGGGDYIDCMQKAGSDHVQQQQCAEQFRQNVQDRLSVDADTVALTGHRPRRRGMNSSDSST